MNFRVVPYIFTINTSSGTSRFSHTDLINILIAGCKINITASNKRNIIGNILSYSFEDSKRRLYIHIDADYKNTSTKGIINNATLEVEGLIGDKQTQTNQFIFIFDFLNIGALSTGGGDPNGIMYVIYEGDSYSVAKELLSHLNLLFKKHILDINTYQKNNEYVNDVKKFIKGLEVKYVCGPKNEKIGTFIVPPEQIRDVSDFKTFINSITENSQGIANLLKNYIKVDPNGKVETIIFAKVFGKKRMITKEEKKLIILDFPQEIDLKEKERKTIESLLKHLSNNIPAFLKSEKKNIIMESSLETISQCIDSFDNYN